MAIQQNVQAEVLQSEKANTNLGPGNKGHEGMSGFFFFFLNNLFNYRYLSLPKPIEGGAQLVPGTQLDNYQVDLKTEQTPQLKGKKRPHQRM